MSSPVGAPSLLFTSLFFFVPLLLHLSSVRTVGVVERPRTFEIDYDNDQFVMDGQPFRYASGEMHYFRVPSQYWKDRLHKFKAAGLNAVSTYIEWSLHEPSPKQYDFTADRDIVNFVKLAEAEGLYVIIRPGPYICAERDFGGYPAWLLTVNPNMKLRTSDASHTFFITRWFKQLMPRIQPLLYGNGGPIIMVQVENEYGSYPVHDPTYLIWLRDLYRSYVGNAAVLFTTDGPAYSYLTRGHIPGVFATIDFGPLTISVNDTFGGLRKLQPNGPLVNSEFYAGWMSYWGEPFSSVSIEPIKATLQQMLANNVSFNIYMFHGGTNFGFTAGSGSDKFFQPDLTSYDYDAPISESGDLTDKYYAIREVLSTHYPTLELTAGKKGKNGGDKGDYGEVTLAAVVTLWDSPVGSEPTDSVYPLSFEALGQRYGLVAYHTRVPPPCTDPPVLQVNIRDRAIVYIDKKEVGVLQYTVINETPLPSNLAEGQTLTLLIENMGRRNYKILTDCTKGLISNATIDGKLVKSWRMVGYPLSGEDVARVENLAGGTTRRRRRRNTSEADDGIKTPAFYTGQFKLDEDQKPQDTFLDMSGWGKGVAWINGFNLGRYWHVGPQVRLYLPGVHLKQHPFTNNVTVLELQNAHVNTTVRFFDKPYLNKSVNSYCSL